MMRRMLVLAAVLSAAAIGTAHANQPAQGHAQIARLFSAASIRLPTEWNGRWAYRDTTYDCLHTVYVDPSEGVDTLCTGMMIDAYDPIGIITYSCTGSASATVIDMTCIGTGTQSSCTWTEHIHLHAVRTASHMTMEITDDTTTAPADCDPGGCQRYVMQADRIGDAPPDYCVTPVRQMTWGQLKQLYR